MTVYDAKGRAVAEVEASSCPLCRAMVTAKHIQAHLDWHETQVELMGRVIEQVDVLTKKDGIG